MLTHDELVALNVKVELLLGDDLSASTYERLWAAAGAWGSGPARHVHLGAFTSRSGYDIWINRRYRGWKDDLELFVKGWRAEPRDFSGAGGDAGKSFALCYLLIEDLRQRDHTFQMQSLSCANKFGLDNPDMVHRASTELYPSHAYRDFYGDTMCLAIVYAFIDAREFTEGKNAQP